MSAQITAPDGSLIRFQTAKLGVGVFRQRSGSGDSIRYSNTWYYEKMVNGETARFPIGLKKGAAERLADEIASFLSIPSNTLEMAVAKYNPRHKDRLTHFATVGECLTAYEKALNIIGRRGKAISLKSFKGYRSFLLTMIRKVEAYRRHKDFVPVSGKHRVDYSKWLDQSTEILTAKFMQDFKMASIDADEEDQEVIMTAKITADTCMRNARALFSRSALEHFKSIGLHLPDLTEFMKVPDLGGKKFFQLLPAGVISKIMSESIELRNDDEEAYRAFILCVQCGLRAGEAAAFRPTWLRDEDRPVIYIKEDGAFRPKHGHGRKTYLEPWVATVIKDLFQGNDFIIDNPDCFKRLNVWIKSRIPDTDTVSKPTHELRKLWFSQKVKREGLLAAAQQGGHEDVKITQTNYADNGMQENLLPFWTLPTGKAVKHLDSVIKKLSIG